MKFKRDPKAFTIQVCKAAVTLLPRKLRWVPHNVFAHPTYEILKLFTFHNVAQDIHDMTIPYDEESSTRSTHNGESEVDQNSR
jgi:hypothetical protein